MIIGIHGNTTTNRNYTSLQQQTTQNEGTHAIAICVVALQTTMPDMRDDNTHIAVTSFIVTNQWRLYIYYHLYTSLGPDYGNENFRDPSGTPMYNMRTQLPTIIVFYAALKNEFFSCPFSQGCWQLLGIYFSCPFSQG